MATIKQMLAARAAVENGGNVSKAMITAGYSRAMAHNPHKLTRSPAWQELLEKALPDKLLSKKHREFLTSKKVIRTYQRGELKEVVEETDANAVKALDMAYKLKNRYQEKAANNVLVVNISSENSARYAPEPVPSTPIEPV